MAELTIRLQIDPVTGRRDIVVQLRSDADALPHEHETLHKQLVDKLVAGGLLSPDAVGKLIIEREPSGTTGQASPLTPPAGQTQAEPG